MIETHVDHGMDIDVCGGKQIGFVYVKYSEIIY